MTADVQAVDELGRTIYEPDGIQLERFLVSSNKVDIIRGPVGSGKSVGSMMRVWRHANEQQVGARGRRSSRWAIVRNTYPDLEQSTVKTWLNLFPEEVYGRFLRSKPMMHMISVGDLDLEVVFLALDKAEDIRKLRSTEWTGILFNELQYIPKELFDEATTRVGRYPAIKDGGPTWYGVIADMNAPDEDHWLPMMTGEVELPDYLNEDEREQWRWPSEWGYFLQPAGLIEEFGPDGRTVVGYKENPLAENRKWLKQGYLEMVRGKTRPFIDSRLMNRITVLVDGDPVWAQFRLETHVARTELRPLPGHQVYVGLDFGRRPAMVAGQMVGGRWQVLYELQRFDTSAQRFAPEVKRFLATRFPANTVFRFFGDPKGRDKLQNNDTTAFDIFEANGIKIEPAPVKNNDIRTRIEAVDYVLGGLQDGMPRFLLNASCRGLKVAMAGKYHWKKGERDAEPAKDKYSDLADALQYMILGAGEGRALIGKPANANATPVNTRSGRRTMRRA